MLRNGTVEKQLRTGEGSLSVFLKNVNISKREKYKENIINNFFFKKNVAKRKKKNNEGWESQNKKGNGNSLKQPMWETRRGR